jgi:hypothetical protein
MAADEMNMQATEPTEPVVPELDQPEHDDSVSLEQVLSGTESATASVGEKETGDQEPAGDAAPQADAAQEKVYRTQADFDRAFGQRAAGLRRQWERERSEDLALAGIVRQRYQGKSLADIRESLIAEEARELALETGYSEDEAVQKVQARHAYEQKQSGEIDHVILDKMSKQMADFEQKYGIDLVPVMESDESLLNLVGDDGDLRDVMIAVLSKRAEGTPKPAQIHEPQRPNAPRVETSGASRTAAVARDLTDDEFEKIDAMLKRGVQVRV